MKHILTLSLVLFFLSCTLLAQNNQDAYGFKYKKGAYYLTNPKGKKVKGVEPFSFVEPFSDGLALVERDLKFGFIDTSGKLVIDYMFFDAGGFVNGITYAEKGGKYGYINKTGAFVLHPQFKRAFNFQGDFAKVQKQNPDTLRFGNAQWISAMIDKTGKVIGDRYFTTISYDPEQHHFKAYTKDSVFNVSTDGEVSFKKLNEKDVFIIVDEMPQFRGGDLEIRKYIATSIRYPFSAQRYSIQGKCKIQFVIDENGDVTRVNSVSTRHPLLEKESRRVVKNMPYWLPGKKDGKTVKVSYTMPINFVLQ